MTGEQIDDMKFANALVYQEREEIAGLHRKRAGNEPVQRKVYVLDNTQKQMETKPETNDGPIGDMDIVRIEYSSGDVKKMRWMYAKYTKPIILGTAKVIEVIRK